MPIILLIIAFFFLGTKSGREVMVNWVSWLVLIYASIEVLSWLIVNKYIH